MQPFADDNTRRVLERFASNVTTNARRALQAKRKKVSIRSTWKKTGGQWTPTSSRRTSYLSDTVATGRLANTLKSGLTDRAIFFEMEYYGQWVDQGRKPSRKFPPPLALRKWLDDNRVKVRSLETGRFIKNSQGAKKAAAFLIGRKIKQYGIPATGFFTNIFLRAYDKLPYDIQDALAMDLDIAIKKLQADK